MENRGLCGTPSSGWAEPLVGRCSPESRAGKVPHNRDQLTDAFLTRHGAWREEGGHAVMDEGEGERSSGSICVKFWKGATPARVHGAHNRETARFDGPSQRLDEPARSREAEPRRHRRLLCRSASGGPLGSGDTRLSGIFAAVPARAGSADGSATGGGG